LAIFNIENQYVNVAEIESTDATDAINTEADAAFTTWDPPTEAEMDARTLLATAYYDYTTDEVDVGTIEGVDASNEIDQAPTNAIVAYKLDHLLAVADADDPVNGSIIAEMASATEDWSTFVAADDSLEAISDAVAVVGGACAAESCTFAAADSCWTEWGDPGDVDDALAVLCGYVDGMLIKAPVLDDIDWNSSEGASGKNTWNAANPIGGYANPVASGSVNNSGGACDVTMGTSGNEHGVIASGSVGDKYGTLNEDVPSTDNYPANAFGPGKEDGGSVNDLYLVLNDSTLHTVDLLTHAGGADLNGNGSGFSALAAADNVLDAKGDPVPGFYYRTGTWKLDTADMVDGYNVVWIEHATDAGTTTSNVEEFILDDCTTATGYAAASFSGYPGAATTKDLSGVTYHNGTVTATYGSGTISNSYCNTWSSGTAVTHSDTNCSIPDEALANSACDEAKTFAVSQTATVDVTRITGGNLVVNTTVNRTVQSDTSGASTTQSQCLVDRDTQSNTDLAHYYADEDNRIRSNQDFNTDLTPAWSGSQTIVDAGAAGYSNGLQVTEDVVLYPGEGTVDDYSALTSGPGGNPDYSAGVTGTRYYFGMFTDATGRSNFALNIQGSATLVDEGTLSASTDEVSIAIRLPSETGWMDINQDYAAGQWGSTSESATATATVGCYAETYGADKTIPTSALGFTVGTKTTDDSYDKIYYRISAPQGWTGNIASITITWGA
jgi:hypothetical protein